MKRIFCCAVLVLCLMMTGCSSGNHHLPGASSQTHHEEGSSPVVSSQTHHDEVSAAFLNSMGCADKTCTDASHFHNCPADCADYDHYHNCSLDCTETSHHHSGHTAEGGHKEQQHNSGSHHE